MLHEKQVVHYPTRRLHQQWTQGVLGGPILTEFDLWVTSTAVVGEIQTCNFMSTLHRWLSHDINSVVNGQGVLGDGSYP